MNTIVNHIPKSWKPYDTKAFNRFIAKINKHVEKTKL